ncbi:MAG: ABC transporter permease subunit [Spirochaetia bacterium]|nr:ABC transporter permease subunit [Spirochaetia bacterium]
MMGIPLSIGGSLLLALLLNQNLKGKFSGVRTSATAVPILIGSIILLVSLGMHATAITLLLGTLFSLIMLSGLWAGSALYRTLFYLPHFTSGVATYILWKKLYNPQTGPINLALFGPLEALTKFIKAVPSVTFTILGFVAVAGVLLMFFSQIRRLFTSWKDGSLGIGALIVSGFILLLPFYFGISWVKAFHAGQILAIAAGAIVLVMVVIYIKGQDFKSKTWFGMNENLVFTIFMMTIEFLLIGLVIVIFNLPDMAKAGIKPPEWLTNYHWAKPALMLMGLWGAIGSNNMILYQAGLSVIPQDLYEAAEVDGATSLQKFWYVTWPQLAPTTFFIFVMSIIGGLQGGFETARTMTQGGPAGSTTTITYYLYEQGFESGRLGFASGVAWALFVFIFIITAINWRYGRKNETE